jgi:hypothetical protein
MLVVDAANVIGAVPDGWWRDRPGAAVRLHTRLQSAMAAGLLGNERVVLVLEGAARAGVPCGADGDLEVRHAPRDADEEVRRLVAETPGAVRVVTADRRLAADCVAAGARVLGPRWLLDRLP